MDSKVPVQLGPIQETMLVPLLGRAEETRKRNGMLIDNESVKIVDSLDYDFSKWAGKDTLIGATLRARIFDEEVGRFLTRHPNGTIIEIGAGLNTRFERMDNGTAHWIEIDLPDSMELRRQFFQDHSRRQMIAASVTDTQWYALVKERPGPYCFVSEAVIIYLDNDVVAETLHSLAQNFPGAWLITDTCSTKMVESQGQHDVMSTFPKESWFRWRCDEPRSLENLGLKLLHSRSFADVDSSLVKKMPWKYRLMWNIAPWLVKRMVNGYLINQFQFNDSA